MIVIQYNYSEALIQSKVFLWLLFTSWPGLECRQGAEGLHVGFKTNFLQIDPWFSLFSTSVVAPIDQVTMILVSLIVCTGLHCKTRYKHFAEARGPGWHLHNYPVGPAEAWLVAQLTPDLIALLTGERCNCFERPRMAVRISGHFNDFLFALLAWGGSLAQHQLVRQKCKNSTELNENLQISQNPWV